MSEPANVFIDAAGRKWKIEFNVAAIRRMRIEAKFYLDEVFSPTEMDAQLEIKKYNAFLNDDLRFSDVLFAILRPDAEKIGVTKEQFEAALAAEANVKAIRAFHEEFTNFSKDRQQPREIALRTVGISMDEQTKAMMGETWNAVREKHTQAMNVGKKHVKKATMNLEAELAKLDDNKLEQLMQDGIDQASKPNVKNGLANSESIPIPSHTESS